MIVGTAGHIDHGKTALVKALTGTDADRLAEAVGLDMTGYWSATVASYLGRVTKARIGEAVREAVSDEAAERIGGMKKPDMASEAEALLAGKGWLPSLLRAPVPVEPEVQSEAPSLTSTQSATVTRREGRARWAGAEVM